MIWRLALLLAGLSACDTTDVDPTDPAIGTPNPTGSPDDERADRYIQQTPADLDVLIVLDNSPTMEEEHAAYGSTASSFVDRLIMSGASFQLGVMLADVEKPEDRGALVQIDGTQRFLLPDAEDAAIKLEAALSPDLSFGDRQTPRKAAVLSLSAPMLYQLNDGFRRTSAELHLIVISDRDDESAADPTAVKFAEFLQEQLAPRLTYNVIVGPPGGCATADEGTEHLAVQTFIGGARHSLCGDAEEGWLEVLGAIKRTADQAYSLTTVPDLSTVQVEVLDGSYAHEGWSEDAGQTTADCTSEAQCFSWWYDPTRNAVAIPPAFIVPPGAEVEIRYTPAP